MHARAAARVHNDRQMANKGGGGGGQLRTHPQSSLVMSHIHTVHSVASSEREKKGAARGDLATVKSVEVMMMMWMWMWVGIRIASATCIAVNRVAVMAVWRPGADHDAGCCENVVHEQGEEKVDEVERDGFRIVNEWGSGSVAAGLMQ